jgi:hypothetical protein
VAAFVAEPLLFDDLAGNELVTAAVREAYARSEAFTAKRGAF